MANKIVKSGASSYRIINQEGVVIAKVNFFRQISRGRPLVDCSIIVGDKHTELNYSYFADLKRDVVNGNLIVSDYA